MGHLTASSRPAFVRRDVEFFSGGVRCAAWLYQPTGVERPPLVIMAHGFGGERGFTLPRYAERFAGAGLAVLLFDYRNFGGSDGEPRNLVSPRRHLQDWAAAVHFAKTVEGVDHTRIGLWGTSFSGGHVLVTAARFPEIRAVVSHVPAVDVLKSIRGYGLRFRLWALGHAVCDFVQSALLRRAHYIPLVTENDGFAALHAPGCYDGYSSTIPTGASFENRCPARILFTAPFYRPTTVVSRIACPTLMIVARDDQLTPAHLALEAAKKIQHAEVIMVDCDHFAPYHGERFTDLVEKMTQFLTRSFSTSPAPASRVE